jgi:hypothetical protein
MTSALLPLLVLASAAATSVEPASLQDTDRPIVAPCAAAAPAPGAIFSGPVLQVIDAEHLCIAAGPTPAEWIAVRPKAASGLRGDKGRSVLMSATFSKRLDCVAGPADAGGVEAACTVEGADLAEKVKAASQDPQWRSWR